MESITSVYVNFNFNYALDLYTKTDFSICYKVIDAVKNSDLKRFIVGGMNCEIHFLPFVDDSHFNDGQFLLFIDSDDEAALDKISDDENLKRQIKDQLEKVIDYLNSENIVIPIDNLDNVVYLDSKETFYVKLGETKPNTLKLIFSIDEYSYACI